MTRIGAGALRRVILIAGGFGVIAAPVAAAPPFYVKSVREVCKLPRPDNDGRVLGHDGGTSVVLNGRSYWFFADTNWDNATDPWLNNGALDWEGDGFIGMGTAASTTDLTGGHCTSWSYRHQVVSGVDRAVDFMAGSALHSDECLLWPLGSVAANNQIYVYVAAVKKDPVDGSCKLGNQHEYFLATVNLAAGSNYLKGTRGPTITTASQPAFWAAFNVSEPDGCGGTLKWVYVGGWKPGSATGSVAYLLARVLEADIATPSNYQYWNGSGWVANTPSAAVALFEDQGAGQIDFTYNNYLGRWLAVYSCGNGVCARTATTAGNSTAALVGGWSERTTMFTCAGTDGFVCYLPHVHAELGSGQTIYITSSFNRPLDRACNSDADCRCTSDPAPSEVCSADRKCTMPTTYRRYGLQMREVVLNTAPTPAGRSFVDSAMGYSPSSRVPPSCEQPVQGKNGWYYKQLSMSGPTITNLSYDWLWSWVGTDSVGGYPAPALDEDRALPSNTKGALRVWAPSWGGRARISGEARKRFNSCGDGAIVEIIQILGGFPSGEGAIWATLWSAVLTNPNPARLALFDLPGIILKPGDQIGFLVQRGGTTANCDDVSMEPTIVFDRLRLQDNNGDGQVRVVALGDSNTWQLCTCNGQPCGCSRWPQYLQNALAAAGYANLPYTPYAPVTVDPGTSVWGATVLDYGSSVPNQDGPEMILNAIALNPRPDVAILALGTNDIKVHGTPALAILNGLATLKSTLENAGIDTLIAFVPPFASPADAPTLNPQVDELNTDLTYVNALAGKSEDLVDFHTVQDGDFDGDGVLVPTRDGVHFNTTGQQRRAQAAMVSLAPDTAP